MLLEFKLIIILSVYNVGFSQEHYAVLISAGRTIEDDNAKFSPYWYDLFLAYEDLIINQGYTHDKVFVFYGNGAGDDFSSAYTQYNISKHNWSGIVDFDNRKETMFAEFANIASIVTNEDNLLIRWVCGHGTIPYHEPNNDSYRVIIENEYNEDISESNIISLVNSINCYKRRKILWMTCYSGCLVEGNKTLNNSKTCVITSSAWDELSGDYYPNASGGSGSIYKNVSAEFNWVVTSALSGGDPLGNSFDADHNGDNVISMIDLYEELLSNSIMESEPQLDGGLSGEMIFIKEDLELKDITLHTNLYGMQSYWTESNTIENVSIIDNSDVLIEFDDEVVFQSDFYVEQGSVLDVYN